MKDNIKGIFIILSVSLFFSLFESVIVFAGGQPPQGQCATLGAMCGYTSDCCIGLSCVGNVCDDNCGFETQMCCAIPNTYNQPKCDSGLICLNNVCTQPIMKIWIKEPDVNQVSCSSFDSESSCNENRGCKWKFIGCSDCTYPNCGSDGKCVSGGGTTHNGNYTDFNPDMCQYFDQSSCVGYSDNGCVWQYTGCANAQSCSGSSESACNSCNQCHSNYGCIYSPSYIVDGTYMPDCSRTYYTESCLSYYHTCNVNGWYQGQVMDIGTGAYSPWTNLWCCGPDCPITVSNSSLSVYISGYKICNVSANMTSNLDGKYWEIKDENGNVECSGTVSGTDYSYTCQNWTVGVGTYTYSLYVDNMKAENSKTVDCPVSETCNYNRKCDGNENCLNCVDCGCTINQTCSSDETCKNIPTPPPCNYDGICQQGEGCTCSDCIGKKDSCGDGDLVCLTTPVQTCVPDYNSGSCCKNGICAASFINTPPGYNCNFNGCDENCLPIMNCTSTTPVQTNDTCQCPSDKPYWCVDHCDISPNCTCGNGIIDEGENCKNCPNDAGCSSGLRCCQDGVCRSDCNGPGCDLNQICDRNETYYETCDCSDCTYLQDRCILGDICTADGKCGCNPISDGICTRDISCIASDPDCQCNNNGICEPGETQDGCSDCNTKVIVSPSRLYPSEKINVTAYFNDSRYVIGENAKVVLYIDNTPWTSCAVHDSKWKDDLNWDGNTNWIANNVMGRIQGPISSSVKITSINSYARIDFDCTVPPDLSQGTHTLKAVPYIYSKEIELGSSETQFTVPNNSLMLMKFILFSIKLIF
jgi:hypothetical protein